MELRADHMYVIVDATRRVEVSQRLVDKAASAGTQPALEVFRLVTEGTPDAVVDQRAAERNTGDKEAGSKEECHGGNS